jgi:pyridoxamine 5'-phosphate oxidase
MENLHDKRKVYEKSQLIESEIKQNPIEQFRDWFLEASEILMISEANAMAISTVEEDGCPEQEWFCLKHILEGFIFYTNYDSRKGKSIERTHKACLHFFWPGWKDRSSLKQIWKKLLRI